MKSNFPLNIETDAQSFNLGANQIREIQLDQSSKIGNHLDIEKKHHSVLEVYPDKVASLSQSLKVGLARQSQPVLDTTGVDCAVQDTPIIKKETKEIIIEGTSATPTPCKSIVTKDADKSLGSEQKVKMVKNLTSGKLMLNA